MNPTETPARSSDVSAPSPRLSYGRFAATVALGLAALALPGAAAADGEIGAELRVSDMGNPGASYAAQFPQVAYNPIDHEFLVVWQGDDNLGGSVDQVIEIFGQRIDADGFESGDTLAWSSTTP